MQTYDDIDNFSIKEKVNIWIQKAQTLYENIDCRKDITLWHELLTDKVYVSQDTCINAIISIKNFFKTHPYLPYNVIHEIEQIDDECILSDIYEQIGDFDAFYVYITSGKTLNDIADNWSVDNYIKEFRSLKNSYYNGEISAQIYFNALNELSSKGYESIYDMKERVVLCLLLGIDGRTISRQLAEYDTDIGIAFKSAFHKSAAFFKSSKLYGRAAELYYEEKYNDAVQILIQLLDYTNVGVDENIDAEDIYINKLIAIAYEKIGTTLLQEYEKIVLDDEYKKRAMKENTQYEYYIICADYYYVKQNFIECMKILDWLDGIFGKHKEALVKRWGLELYIKRYRHNLYLIAQTYMYLSDYESAMLYAQLLYEEDEECIKAYSIHMQCAFYLHQFYIAEYDYQKFMNLLKNKDKLTKYQDESPHFIASFIHIAWAFYDINRPTLFESSEDCYNAACDILNDIQKLKCFSKKSAYLLEIAQNKIGIDDPKILLDVLSIFLDEKEASIQEMLKQHNPLFCYYYAIGKCTNASDKLEIFSYLHEKYGVYGMACVYLALNHQKKYFDIDFKKQDKEKALEYLKLQASQSDNKNDGVFLGLYFLRLLNYIEAVKIFYQVLGECKRSNIWYWIAMASQREFGLDGIKAYKSAITHGCDNADMWYSYGKYILESWSSQKIEEVEYCANHIILSFPEAKWKGMLLWADYCLWNLQVENADDYINKAYISAKDKVGFEDKLFLYRRLLYSSWISKKITRAWELTNEVEQFIIEQCYNNEDRIVHLYKWWVYAARIMLNISVSETITFLQERIEKYQVDQQVLTNPNIAKSGMEIYKKMIMLLFLDNQNQALQDFANKFMTCFHIAYPQGALEDYINVKENLPERMDQAGWYYMAIGNTYLAEMCFKKQISEKPCYRCKARVCYKGYLNMARLCYKRGDKKLAKSNIVWLKLPEVCKNQLFKG